MRGGVSKALYEVSLAERSSPRAWGCFHGSVGCLADVSVFPTCVGVFLLAEEAIFVIVSLPHVRGGVSQFADKLAFSRRSSPRAWGCFHRPSSPALR